MCLFTFYNCYYEKIGKEVKNITGELPFEIPSNWTWARLKNGYVCVGTGVKKYDGVRNYYSTGSINGSLYSPEGIYSYGNRPSRANRCCYVGDVIDAKMEKTEKCTIIDSFLDSQLFSTGFFQIRCLINNNQYLKVVLESPYFQIRKNSLCAGVTQKSITDSNLENILVPIPPLNEQDKIVAKINKKFSVLLNKYQLIEEELSLLESSFKERLKTSILQYAIEGKLVKQDPNDEPASALLEQIEKEKERLIQKGKIKRDKHESKIVVGDDKNYSMKLPFN